MKIKLICTFLLLLSYSLLAEKEISPDVKKDIKKVDIKEVFSELNPDLITTGFLANKSLELIPFDDYNGQNITKTLTKYKWEMLLAQLKDSQIDKMKLIPPIKDIYQKYSKRSRSDEVISISLIDASYNIIKEGAFEKNILKVEGKKIIESNLRNNRNPYLQKNLFAASILKKKIFNGSKVKYKFDENFYFSNKNNENVKYLIDFDDGKGYKPVKLNQVIEISYSSTGIKKLKFKSIRNNNIKGSRYYEKLTSLITIKVEGIIYTVTNIYNSFKCSNTFKVILMVE